MSKLINVQDFIYKGLWIMPDDCPLKKNSGEVDYARWVMSMHDVPATLSMDIEEYIKQHPLYCMLNGVKHKFINVSRLGDVFINDDLTAKSYNKRVPITELYTFSKE
ncbi:hypothetical protein ACWIYZ_04740 [Ursidibacter arcticus]